jgi:signal transduction histidine kinase
MLLLRLFACVLLLISSIAVGNAQVREVGRMPVIEITQAEETVAAAIPTLEERWKPITLPVYWTRPMNTPLQTQWIRAKFKLSEVPDSGLVLYIARNYNGGNFYLNGMRIAGLKPPGPAEYIRWRRPVMIELPYAFLLAGENELLMQSSFRGGNSGITPWFVGHEEDLQGEFESTFFVAHTVPRMVMAYCIVGGLFMLWFWWKRRDEVLYGLIGMGSLFWVLRMQSFIFEWGALQWRSGIRFLLYTGTAGFMVCALIVIMRMSQLRMPKFEKFTLFYAAAGPLIYLVSQQPLELFLDRFWLGGLLIILLAAVLMLNWQAWRKRTGELLGVAVVVNIAMLMAVNDWLTQSGVLPFDLPTLSHFVAPMLLTVIFGVIISRFIELLNANETLNRDLIDRLAIRETELNTKYSEQNQIEQRRITLEERARIMQDMHDGLGSQLLSSLVMVERSEVSKIEVIGILRDALDDLRLAIDAFSPDGAELLPALGNLRFRMQGRFKAAHVPLSWTMVNVPDTFSLPATATLPILRVLQESLTNILKHSHAAEARVYVTTRTPPLALVIEIYDNGKGFDTRLTPTRGRGLTNLHKRANRIGGELEVISGRSGTRITLTVPLTA